MQYYAWVFESGTSACPPCLVSPASLQIGSVAPAVCFSFACCLWPSFAKNVSGLCMAERAQPTNDPQGTTCMMSDVVSLLVTLHTKTMAEHLTLTTKNTMAAPTNRPIRPRQPQRHGRAGIWIRHHKQSMPCLTLSETRCMATLAHLNIPLRFLALPCNTCLVAWPSCCMHSFVNQCLTKLR